MVYSPANGYLLCFPLHRWKNAEHHLQHRHHRTTERFLADCLLDARLLCPCLYLLELRSVRVTDRVILRPKEIQRLEAGLSHGRAWNGLEGVRDAQRLYQQCFMTLCGCKQAQKHRKIALFLADPLLDALLLCPLNYLLRSDFSYVACS